MAFTTLSMTLIISISLYPFDDDELEEDAAEALSLSLIMC